jgi:hypothetical protein
MKGPGRIRKGLGVLYLLAGLIHAATMVLASLYSLGRLPWVISAGTWSQLYYAHYLFMALGGGAYLALSFRADGLFYPESLLDFAVGFGVFVPLVSVTAVLLVRGLVSAWFSLVPSAFLLAYGAGLLRGRRLGFGARG